MVFDQEREEPGDAADAMLTIGDRALRRSRQSPYPHVYDLGLLWHEFTGLPFVFALWQVNYKKNIDKELSLLYHSLTESKQYGLGRLPELATDHAGRFGLPEELLLEYWRTFSYDFGEGEQKGLLTFYGYAAELGIIEKVPDLRFLETR
jgi:chorismate dehydratase